jgi:mono/diheme cytochrome c family protein
MLYMKYCVVAAFAIFGLAACFTAKKKGFVIADSKSYETSMFRQNCAICHGPEADGKILDNGTKVPSLREGEFKFKTEEEIFKQITDGGNGMTPFRGQLTDRERHMMAAFVFHDLRGN